MKSLLLVTILLALGFFMVRYSRYEDRMKKYNENGCAVYGYKSDCKTKLDN